MKKKRRDKEYDNHHRRPQCLGGSDTPSNISRVLQKHHQAYHQLFSHGGDVRLIAKYLNDVWIDPKYKLVVVEVVIPNENQLNLFNEDV